jgi:hypothetical protein
MSTMNGVQRAALRLAKSGDWSLADAIEVQHRCVYGGALCGIADGPGDGRLVAFAYSDDSTKSIEIGCTNCTVQLADEAEFEGGKTTPEIGPEEFCHECGGSRYCVDPLLSWLDDENVRFETLNGDPIPLEEGFVMVKGDTLRTIEHANAVIYGYSLDLERAPVQAALFPDAKAA